MSGHTPWIYSVPFSPDGQVLASCSYDGIIRLWDVSTTELLHTLRGHTAGVYSVAFSPEGKFIASGSRDGTVLLWDMVALDKEVETQ